MCGLFLLCNTLFSLVLFARYHWIGSVELFDAVSYIPLFELALINGLPVRSLPFSFPFVSFLSGLNETCINGLCSVCVCVCWKEELFSSLSFHTELLVTRMKVRDKMNPQSSIPITSNWESNVIFQCHFGSFSFSFKFLSLFLSFTKVGSNLQFHMQIWASGPTPITISKLSDRPYCIWLKLVTKFTFVSRHSEWRKKRARRKQKNGS